MRLVRIPRTTLVVIVLLLALPLACSSDAKPTFTLRPTMVFSPVSGGTPTGPAENADALPSDDTSPLIGAQPADPKPTVPSQPTTPAPTMTQFAPTPTAVPVSVWLGADVPAALVQATADLVSVQPSRYVVTDDRSLADIHVGGAGTDDTPVATWVYALVAPFPTLADGVSWEVLRGVWTGASTGPFAGRPLMMSQETLAALAGVLGDPGAGAVAIVPESELLDRAWSEQPAWAVVPFEALQPRWKVLRIDGLSSLDNELDQVSYPLVAQLSAAGPEHLVDPFLAVVEYPSANRDENRMTAALMTGVTALTRATAWRMEQKGLTYPAEAIGDWLRNADITHVSNEVSFDPECGPPNPVQEELLFCSDPRYIELLEHIGVDVVEMTGNHIADAGAEHIEPTLDMYVERGWEYFGGGRNLEDARQPAIFEHNGNTIAFLGCNPVGPSYVWAEPERAGANPCDYELLYAQIAELRSRGVLPIVTLQYWEMDRYDPTPQQVADFQALIDAGAVIVSGSHAHHIQGFGFHGDGFIHYGIGNLFFDQMQMLGYMQEFIDRHIFYEGRHISTEILTAMLEDWSRPRPMTEQERNDVLQTVFDVSVWE